MATVTIMTNIMVMVATKEMVTAWTTVVVTVKVTNGDSNGLC